jgi:protein tyrosine/serine phosphatase
MTRDLDWEGCFNVRDLGGLPAADGRHTRWGALVRADAVDRLTAAGWAALHDHGVRTIAPAGPGGVLIHCVGGRDRTGLIAMLLLALAGVAPGDIADDHALSAERLVELYARAGEADQGAIIDELLEREGTTAREPILTTLASLDVEGYLCAAGLGDDDLTAVRERLLA